MVQSLSGRKPKSLQGNDMFILCFRQSGVLILHVIESFWTKNIKVKCSFKEEQPTFLPAQEEITWIKVCFGTGT